MDYVDHIRQHANQPLTHQLLVSLLKSFKQPNDKIHKLMRDGFILPIKKGLYIAGPRLNSAKPEPFLLANHILGPSYISVETALAHHGYIPERVYEIASMTTKTSRTFKTSVGTFTYTRLSLPYYAFGIERVRLTDDQYAMVASPAKAICDKIITTTGLLFRSKKSVQEFLIENMRMDTEKLKELSTVEMATWIPKSLKGESLLMVINAINDL
jgi:predicted transcriptional regulator of viral defense system